MSEADTGPRRGGRRALGATLLLALALGAGGPLAADVAARELLLAADASWHVVDEGIISVRALVRGPDGVPFTSELDVYVKGADRTLCVFREGKQKGRRVLVVGDKVWLIVPGSKRPIPISASQRLLGGASVADVARMRLADEFDGTVRSGSEDVDGKPCRVVDLVARSAKASYAAGTLWIDEGDRLPRRLRLALRSGKQAKEVLFTAFRREGGREVLSQMEIRHLLPHERGQMTLLDYVRYRPAPLDPALFAPEAGVPE